MQGNKEDEKKTLNSDLLSNSEFQDTIANEDHREARSPQETEAYEKEMRKQFWQNFAKIAVVSLCKLSYGYYLVIFNPLSGIVFPHVYHFNKEEIKHQEGDVNMFFYIGATLFGLIGGWLAEKLGRKRLIIVFDVANVIISVCFWFPNIYFLKVIRFFNGGVTSCHYMVSSVLIAELFPRKVSGVANVSMFALSTAALFLALVLPTKVFSEEFVKENWRLFLCWPAPIFFVKAILMLWLFKTDSPRWLVKKIKIPDHMEPESEEAETHIKETLTDMYKITYRHSQVNEVVESTAKMYRENKEKISAIRSLKLLFSPTYRTQMLTVFILAISAQLNGVSYISLYSKEVFNRVSNNGNNVTFCLGVAKLFGGPVAMIFAHLFGRKLNMIIGALLQGFSLASILLAIIIASPVFTYLGVVGFAFGYAIGLGGALESYIPEIVPSFGVSLSITITNTVSIANSKLLPLIAPSVGDKNVVIFFMCCCFLLAALIDATALETKGKQESEVTSEYPKNKCKSFKYK